MKKDLKKRRRSGIGKELRREEMILGRNESKAGSGVVSIGKKQGGGRHSADIICLVCLRYDDW